MLEINCWVNKMTNTLAIFEDRKEELELYYSIMLDIDSDDPQIHTINNARFFKILKSNFLLMLYNLVESCVVSGIMEIYEKLRNENCTYSQVIDEIKNIWVTYQISQVYTPTTNLTTYENRVKRIIANITETQPIVLTKEACKISGNLDSKQIKSLCDKHRIRYTAIDDEGALRTVKNKRNSLSHGDVSFSDCARDLTLSDLNAIKEAVLAFMDGILTGMKNYYNNNGYKNPV